MTGKTGFKPPVRNDIGPSRKSGYEKKRTNPSGLGRASKQPLSTFLALPYLPESIKKIN